MSLQKLEQFQFTKKFTVKLVMMLVYQNHSPESLVKKYGLPNMYLLANWWMLNVLAFYNWNPPFM